jgi:hypothetical protein
MIEGLRFAAKLPKRDACRVQAVRGIRLADIPNF